MSTGGTPGFKAEINVTPLVDVVLVLLIIFMVVTPMLQKSKAVQLPEARNVEEGTKPSAHQLLVVVSAEREVVVEGTTLRGVFLGEQGALREQNTLESALLRMVGAAPDREIFIKADRTLDYGVVRSVMAAFRKIGAKQVVLATRERRE